ncbi:MAG: sulfotransferase [Gemmatimonadota bacterium]
MTPFTTVFVGGSPRSGTTWIQILLSQHPAVATAQETHVFNWYLGHMASRWDEEFNKERPRKVGLHTLYNPEQFREVMRGIARDVLERIQATRPGATVVIEKTPGNIDHWRLALDLFPEARFINVIRDPRAVVASLRSAADTWGSEWAPRSAVNGARRWVATIAAGRALAQATPNYREVRYEALLADTAAEFRGMLEWLGLPADEAFVARAVEACSMDQLRAKGAANVPAALTNEPQGFYRKGEVDGWRKELPMKDIHLIEHVARDVMVDLGYPFVSSRPEQRPVRLAYFDFLDRLKIFADVRLRRMRDGI